MGGTDDLSWVEPIHRLATQDPANKENEEKNFKIFQSVKNRRKTFAKAIQYISSVTRRAADDIG